MTNYKTKLYHCHKVNRLVKIFEDYENINGKPTLVSSLCQAYFEENKCNGITDHGFNCEYADKENKC